MVDGRLAVAVVGRCAARLAEHPRLDVSWWPTLAEAGPQLARSRPEHVVVSVDNGDRRQADVVAEVLELVPDASVVVACPREHEGAGRRAIHAGAQDYLLAEELQSAGVPRTLRTAARVRRMQRELSRRALTDPLTGLATLTRLEDRLELALARSRRQASAIGIIFVGLDRFGLVNATAGYRVGDRVLTEVGQRLTGAVRASDTVARMSGDVFCVLCEEIDDDHEVVALAHRIPEILADPFRVDDHQLYLTASLGVAGASWPTSDAKRLLGEAEAAMWRAKERGRARCEVVDGEMRQRFLRRVAHEEALEMALRRDELRLHYQPKFDLASGQVNGVEALLRWEHPEHGLLEPDSFVDLAEDTGLIVPIGEWVLEQACRQAADWGRGQPGLGVAVNLSLRQFSQPNLVDVVARALRRSGLEPQRLSLEITESIVLEDQGSRVAALLAVSELGVPLAIDDFGTGYASMCWLKRFPASILKIDRTFVWGLPHGEEDSAIVAALINLGRALNMRVVAEGVETAGQLEELRRMGCEEAQGFHLARPQPAEAITELLAARPTAAR